MFSITVYGSISYAHTFQNKALSSNVTFSNFFGASSVIVFKGGGGLILRPKRPVFLCHNPDRGRLPNSRLRFGLPMCSLK